MTFEHVDELRDILIEMKEHSENVIVNLASAAEIDASCLQLLCSAHKTYLNEHKSLELSIQCPEVLQQTVRKSGYAQHKGCKGDKNASCLWLKWAER